MSITEIPQQRLETTGTPEYQDIPVPPSATPEAVERLLSCPRSYAAWLGDLETPRQFANLKEAEKEIAGTPRILDLTRQGASLREALLTLHIPQLKPDQRASIIASPIFEERMFPLLVLFEYRFIKRVPGIVYLLEEASATQDSSYKFVGKRTYQGTVIRIDIANFSGRTRSDGAESTTTDLEENFYPDLFDTLRRYPTIKFIKTIGDEVVLVTTETDDPEIETFTKSFAQRAAGKNFGTHTGIAKGQFDITITPGGKVVVDGQASAEAIAQQKKSKTQSRSEGEIPPGIFRNDSEITVDKAGEIDLPPPPLVSAMHFLKGFNPEKIAALALNPEALEKELRSEMAMLASTVTQYAIKNESPVDRRATAVAITAQSKPEEDVTGWEQNVERIAHKYGGTVIYLDLDKSKKEAIVAFGAQGSNPLFQEERAARFANEVAATENECRIGIESGSIYMSDTGRAGAISDAVNTAVRLANTSDITQTIRVGQEAARRFGENIRPTEPETRQVTLRHIGEHIITGCEKIEILTEERGYVRIQNAREIARKIITDRKKHLDIVGEPGMGQPGILAEVAKILETEHRMAVVKLGRHHEKNTTYGCARRVISNLFPTEEDFTAWMEKTEAEKQQRTLWLNIYRELQGSTETSVLNTKNIAIRELSAIFSRTGNLAITCEEVESADEESIEILGKSGATLITTGSKTGEKHNLQGLRLGVAIAAAIKRLKLSMTHEKTGKDQFIRRLKTHFESRIPQVGNERYNLLTVELELEELIRKGVLKEGEWAFDESLLGEGQISDSVESFLHDFATHEIDRINTEHPAAISTLKIAILLGDCEEDGTVDKVGPVDWRESRDHLAELGILKGRGGIHFTHPSLTEHARQDRRLKPTIVEKRAIEEKMRAHLGFERDSFPMPIYIETCKRMGIVLTSIVAQATAHHSSIGLSQNRILAAHDACQQFLEVTREIDEAKIKGMDTPQTKALLNIHFNLIRSKITIGTEYNETIERTKKLLETAEEVKQDEDFTEEKRKFADLKFKAASRVKNPDIMEEHLAELKDLETDSNTIILREAEILYVRSEPTENRARAKKFAELGLEKLESATNSPEKTKLELQLKGFLYGILRSPIETPSKELEDCIDSLETDPTLAEITDENLRTRLYAAAILWNRNADGDAKRGLAITREIKKSGSEHGLMAATTNALNYELNLMIAHASRLNPEAGFDYLEEIEQLYDREVIPYQENRDLDPLGREIITATCTAYEAAVAQLQIIAANKTNERLADQLHTIRRRIEKIERDAKKYAEQNTRISPLCESYLAYFSPLIEIANQQLEQ